MLTNYVNTEHFLQKDTLKINPYLEKECPAALSFLNALKKQGLNPEKPSEVYKNGTFGWHGPRSDEKIKSIAFNNLIISFRRSQFYGQGEYCTTTADPIQSSTSWGNTNTILVFFILKFDPFFNLNTHYVINNPSQDEMYMVPILIATFNDRVPIQLYQEGHSINRYEWQFEEGKEGSNVYRKMVGQGKNIELQTLFEEKYQQYKNDSSKSSFTLKIKGTSNNFLTKTVTYLYDFNKMEQQNTATKRVRKIRRINIY